MTRTNTQPHLALALTLAVLSSASALPVVAWAQDDTETAREGEATEDAEAPAKEEKLADRIKAVERKVFLKRRRFEVMPYVGLDLNDAFFQHFFVGASAAYHLEDSFALELRGGFALGDLEKDSVRFVRVETGSLPFDPPSLVAHADLDAVWAPIYGKLSLFGESILHFDTFLTAGGGIFVTERTDDPRGARDRVTNVNPSANIGVGQRYFINEWLVLRAELRNYTFLETGGQSDLQNVTVLGLALSGFFPMTFAYEYQ
jgi:outer membrane beta-barrel protein